MGNMTPDDLDRLMTSDDWDRLRLNLRRRFGGQLQRIPGAPDPDDLLHEAVVKLLDGRRRCPTDTKSLFIGSLFNIVRGTVSHIAEKSKREKLKQTSQGDFEPEYPSMPSGRSMDPSDDPAKTPEDEIIDKMDASGLREKILSYFSDDPQLLKIVEYRLDHPEAKPRDIAKALSLDINKDIYNAYRRMKARAKKYKKELRS